MLYCKGRGRAGSKKGAAMTAAKSNCRLRKGEQGGGSST